MEAIILAGGLGTRLQSVVKDTPKSMALVNGRPFLEYLLDDLINQGVARIVLSVGYLHEQIIGHFGKKYRSLKLDYAIETEPLGTGGGIRLAFWKIKGDKAVIVNGDSMFRFDLRQMMVYHESKRSDITIALRKLRNTDRYGRVTLNRSRRITCFSEKDPAAGPGLINGGIYIINKDALMAPEWRGRFSIEQDYFPNNLGHKKIMGFVTNGYFLDIGIPDDYLRAQHDFRTFNR